MTRRGAQGARLVRIGLVSAMLAATVAVVAQPVSAQPAGDARAEGNSCELPTTGEYETAEPAAVGFDAAKLREALAYASIQGSHTIKVFRHGCLAGEGLRDPLLERIPQDNWGQAKAVTGLITGIAQDLGYVDIDEPIGTYLPPDLGDEAHRAVTLRNLLQASSGVDNNQVRELNFLADYSRARSWFALPITHEPGTYFRYDQTATSVVSLVIQRALDQREPGLDYQDFAQRELFDPLGIPESAYFWQRDQAGDTSGYSQLFLRPLEYGRLGELMLQHGSYAGQRVISEEYMRQYHAPASTNCGYGFFVFLNSCEPDEEQFTTPVPERRQVDFGPWTASAPADMYFTDGVGTYTYVIPSLDMVVTRNGEQEMDAVPSALRGDVNDGLIPGQPGGAGDHEFVRLLMDAVTDMPDEVRATIQNPGPYDRPSQVSFDSEQFVSPPDAAPGSYLGVGPGAPEDCAPLRAGCADAPNDGYPEYVGDVPRTVPGIVGAEERPDGS